jgi:Flp pilus assembly protein TadD
MIRRLVPLLAVIALALAGCGQTAQQATEEHESNCHFGSPEANCAGQQEKEKNEAAKEKEVNTEVEAIREAKRKLSEEGSG